MKDAKTLGRAIDLGQQRDKVAAIGGEDTVVMVNGGLGTAAVWVSCSGDVRRWWSSAEARL